MCVPGAKDVRRHYLFYTNWSQRWLWATMSILGMEPGSSALASELNSAISPAPRLLLLQLLKTCGIFSTLTEFSITFIDK